MPAALGAGPIEVPPVLQSALSGSHGVVRPVRVLRPKQVCVDGPQDCPRVFVRAQRLGAGAGDIGSRRCICRAPAWDAPVSLMLVARCGSALTYALLTITEEPSYDAARVCSSGDALATG